MSGDKKYLSREERAPKTPLGPKGERYWGEFGYDYVKWLPSLYGAIEWCGSLCTGPYPGTGAYPQLGTLAQFATGLGFTWAAIERMGPFDSRPDSISHFCRATFECPRDAFAFASLKKAQSKNVEYIQWLVQWTWQTAPDEKGRQRIVVLETLPADWLEYHRKRAERIRRRADRLARQKALAA
ncbi:hypothetical protein OpiT1DRAFT_01253 [Opitutaceae bacterium TAV1]|nr:hypothetical protein OpiT1DRAFT_01253 [Opitutaceae bacterium TAV1]